MNIMEEVPIVEEIQPRGRSRKRKSEEEKVPEASLTSDHLYYEPIIKAVKKIVMMQEKMLRVIRNISKEISPDNVQLTQDYLLLIRHSYERIKEELLKFINLHEPMMSKMQRINRRIKDIELKLSLNYEIALINNTIGKEFLSCLSNLEASLKLIEELQNAKKENKDEPITEQKKEEKVEDGEEKVGDGEEKVEDE